MDKQVFRAAPNFWAGRSDSLHIAVPRGGRSIFSVGVLAIALAALLMGCAAEKQRKRGEADLERLARWLPGTYDNTRQAKEDLRNRIQSPHDPVELTIVPLDSEPVRVSLGLESHAFYMQEVAADDARRVLSQKVILFKVTAKGLVESLYTLVEPLRWRDGQRDPGIFEGMTPKDFTVIPGCELLWKREGETDAKSPPAKDDANKVLESTRLVGANDPKRCQTTSHAAMGLVQVDMRAEIGMNEIATAELQYDSDGRLILGNKDAPFYRFRRTGSR